MPETPASNPFDDLPTVAERASFPFATTYELAFLQQGAVLFAGSYTTKSSAIYAALDIINGYPGHEIIITEITRKTLISSSEPNAVQILKSWLAVAPQV